MTPGKTSFGAILKVNAKLLQTFLLGGTAWLLWPSKPEWWGFGLFSILIGFAAIRTFIEALIAIWKLYNREKTIAELLASGAQPKSSQLASDDILREADMFDEK